MFNDTWCEAIRVGEDAERPWHGLKAPGIKLSCGNFVRHAASLTGQDPKKFIKWPDEHWTTLEHLYIRAMYEPGFALPIMQRGMRHDLSVVGGHYWGYSGTGPAQPQPGGVLVVGKCPMQEEALRRRNFCGPTGMFILDALTRLGYSPADTRDWYMANLVRWMNVNTKGGLPKEWVKDCWPLLQMELRILQPEYILCVGAEATKELCGEGNSLKNMVGRWVPHTYSIHADGAPTTSRTAKVAAIMQPAAVMHAPDQQPSFDKALGYFMNLAAGRTQATSSARGNVDLYIHTARDLHDYVTWVLQQPGLKRIMIDAEWHGMYPTEPGAYCRMVQLCHDGRAAAVIQLHNDRGESVFWGDEAAAMQELRRLLDRDDVMIIGQFLAADTPWLCHMGCDVRHRMTVPARWEDMRGGYAGYFDTGFAAHACNETDDYKLEVLCSRQLDVPRWDTKLAEWKLKYCKQRKIKDEELEGYGPCPTDVLGPYGANDVRYPWHLADLQMREGGKLDCDAFGNSSWRPFRTSMLAALPLLDMHMNGAAVDLDRVDEQTDLYEQLLADMQLQMRQDVAWPTFNHRSVQHCRELLFGENMNGKLDKDGNNVRTRPEGALTLHLRPITTTGKRKQPWDQAVARDGHGQHDPCTDKEVLGILAYQHPVAGRLRDLRFIDKVTTSTLCKPLREDDQIVIRDGRRVYKRGIGSFVQADGRVRTTIYPTTETGRTRSARPPMQVFAKRREGDYARIAGERYKYPLRTVVVSDVLSSEPTVLVETDYAGAELFVAATQSGDAMMIDHCKRSELAKSDPNYYDIHSNTAVRAFMLDCAPTKKGLESIGREPLRVAAKNVAFGILYGRSAEAIARQCCEEGAMISPDEAQHLIDLFLSTYACLPMFQELCKQRVDVGWMANAKGRLRRFGQTRERSVLGELQRQAMNFPMQSLVADCVSESLDCFYYHPLRVELGYKLLLQIHDAVLLEVPVRSLTYVVQRVIPECMVDRVSFYACDLSGTPRSGSPEYRFGIETDIATRWGAKLTTEEIDRLGIDPQLVSGA